MVVGVEDVQLANVVRAVSVQIALAVHDTRRTARDRIAVVIQLGGVARIAIRPRRADIHFVILQAAAATRDVGKLGLVGPFARIPRKFRVVQTQIFPPIAVTWACVFARSIVFGIGAESIHVRRHLFQGDIRAVLIHAERLLPCRVHNDIRLAAVLEFKLGISHKFSVFFGLIFCNRRRLVGRFQPTRHKPVQAAIIRVHIIVCRRIMHIKFRLGYVLVRIFRRDRTAAACVSAACVAAARTALVRKFDKRCGAKF